jgi:ABC-2 type transport system ATP-binding protein
MLNFDNVTKSFREDFWKKPKEVVKQLSFSVSEGSLCGFLGANGAGKTTSIKATLGFIQIDSGNISFNPKMGRGAEEIRSNLGYFPEAPYFYPHMTGKEFCEYLGRLQSVSTSLIRERMITWGDRLSISFAFDRKIRSYSKGMLQRLGFVSTLIHNPKFIILDEPLSGLDPLGRREFKDIMIDLNKSGVTIFFSSHIVGDVEEICDSLVVIRQGELFYSGPMEALINNQTSKNYRVAFSSDSEPMQMGDYIKVYNKLSNTYQALIPVDKKEVFLKDLYEKSGDLQELVLERLSLEEIIYKTDQEKGL